MRRLAARDLSGAIPGTGRGDEIGAMASSVGVFKDNIIQADRLTAEAARLDALQQETRRQAEAERTVLAQPAADGGDGAGTRPGTPGQGRPDLHLEPGLRARLRGVAPGLQRRRGAVGHRHPRHRHQHAGHPHRHGRDQPGVRRPVPPHRAAGRQPGADRRRARPDHRHRPQDRRGRRARPNCGCHRQDGRRALRPGGGGRGEGDGGDRELGAADRPDHRRDRRDRLPDQPAGAQRRRGGGPRRGRRPRLRGGGVRGARPGAALGGGRQGDQGADPHLRSAGGPRRQAGRRNRGSVEPHRGPGGRGAWRHQGDRRIRQGAGDGAARGEHRPSTRWTR